MADKECQLKASFTDEGFSNGNSPAASNNGDFQAGLKQVDEVTVEDSVWTGSICEEFAESGVEQLFENIPELKDLFHVKFKIGEGTFSNVYLAHFIEDVKQLFALKYIIPTSSPERVEREVRCLQEMGGTHNVIGYKGTLRNCDHCAIILPYFSHDKFQEYLPNMTVSDICDYMKNLFIALEHVHSFSIIHRDIKPGNFLHSRTSKRYNLVDFGLAMHEPGSNKAWDIEKKKNQSAKHVHKKNVRVLSPESSKTGQLPKKQRTSPRFSLPSHKLTRPAVTKTAFKSSLKHSQTSKQHDVMQDHKKVVHRDSSGRVNLGLCATNHRRSDVCTLCMKRSTQNSPRAGTSGFRAPEVLMKYPHQTTAVDMWSAGVIMLCLLSGRYPFFRCYDDMTALAQIITLFGKRRVMENAKHVGKYMVCNSTSAGYDLKKVCQKLRLVSAKENNQIYKCCKNCPKIKPEKEETNEKLKTTRITSVSSGTVSNESGNKKAKVRFLSTGHSSQTEKQEETNCVLDKSVKEHLDGSVCSCTCGSCTQYVPKSAFELLERCLDLNPKTRITANEALQHCYFTDTRNVSTSER